MSYNLYIVAPKPYSEAAFRYALGIDEYLKRPTQIEKEVWARREAARNGESTEGQGDVRGDGGS